MVRRTGGTSAVLAGVLAGCSPTAMCFCGGEPAWMMFPFDGERTWTYASTDPATAHALVATSLAEPEEVDGYDLYTVDYRRDAVDGELLWRIRWSSDIEDGVFVHGIGLADLDVVPFSPPVQLTEDIARTGEVLETATGGVTWTSTFAGIEPCPAQLEHERECVRIDVAVDAGEGFPLAGSWWASKGNGVAAFAPAGDPGRWELVDLTCEGECDGSW